MTLGTRYGTNWGAIGNILREYIENLRNILRTCWEQNGNIVGKRQEHQKSKKRENLPQGKNWAPGCMLHHLIGWAQFPDLNVFVTVFAPRLMARTWSCVAGAFVGHFPHRDREFHIGSNFWKFYLIRTSFIYGEPVSLVKRFRLFRLERIFFGVQSVETVGRWTTSYLMAEPACLSCLVSMWKLMAIRALDVSFALL
jgi:hypothetical protein